MRSTILQQRSTILRISAMFPVTNCECERSISTLGLLKTYLRSTMGQGRLTSLALMYIHRYIPVTHTKHSCRFCKEAIEKDYSYRHFNRVINLDTLFVYDVTKFQIFIMFIYMFLIHVYYIVVTVQIGIQ